MSRLRLTQFLMGVTFFYLLFISFFEIPIVFRPRIGLRSGAEDHNVSLHPKPIKIDLAASTAKESPDLRKWRRSPELGTKVSGLVFDDVVFDRVSSKDEFSAFHKSVRDSFVSGRILWEEIKDSGKDMEIPVAELETRDRNESCPDSLSLLGRELGRVVMVPCGLTLGSHVTVVGKPRMAHPESDPKIGLVKGKGESVMVSQFAVDLQGLKVVDGEDPPRILHLNPRLKGDWSGKPVIEHNTCYRMQWGTALRCQGWKSKDTEDTVDGQVKCEKWILDDDSSLEESRAMWWLNRLLGRRKKIEANWPFPFAENKVFVMTITAGLEGFHVSVDGRHVTSFPYRTGFTLEDATGLSVEGDIDVQSVYVSSLPASHPNVAALDHLEMLTKWQAPLLPDRSVDLFIGILSAGTHFAERMATRKSWMQQDLITSSNVVARFFVALHKRKEVNLQLMKEAEFFGDIVIVPYMDNYDLVVLKTVAICEYGVRTVQAHYIMKCDDDTFVRLDAVMLEMKKLRNFGSIYAGNMNYYHRPLRHGKWAVKYEEWPEEAYPPYANGPGYIVSSDIARYVVSEFEQHKLRMFKMEDVSMGMWVQRFSKTNPVEYVHNLKFCQFGCVKNYLTAHYQSPRQMICLWSKLQHTGKPECCNMR